MEEIAVITALNHSASFGNNCVEFKGKKKMLFTSLCRSVIGKSVPSVLSTALNKSVAINYLGEVSAYIGSLNLSFNALDDDVSNATKDKVALERSIKISKQFLVTQGVTWEETAEGWRKITL